MTGRHRKARKKSHVEGPLGTQEARRSNTLRCSTCNEFEHNSGLVKGLQWRRAKKKRFYSNFMVIGLYFIVTNWLTTILTLLIVFHYRNQLLKVQPVEKQFLLTQMLLQLLPLILSKLKTLIQILHVDRTLQLVELSQKRRSQEQETKLGNREDFYG